MDRFNSRVTDDNDWHLHEEGELAIDVLDSNDDIIIVSTISGIDTKDIEIYVDGDTVTVKGRRAHPFADRDDISYYHLECFWGNFSRTVVLPVHVKSGEAVAVYERGVLRITIPKEHQGFSIPITIVDD